MTKRRVGKYVSLTVILTILCLLVFFLVVKNDVFGLSPSYKQYIDKATLREDNTIVTNEGGNRKDDMGSGAKPLSTAVPEAKGKKGSKTNPFVILEIVPDKAMQQLAYLTGNYEDSGLDAMQIGIDAIQSHPGQGTFADSPSLTNLGIRHDVGEWFCEYPYEVRKIGNEDETEKIMLAEVGKWYTIKIKQEDIEKAGYVPADLEKDLESYKNHDQNDKQGKYNKLKDILSSKYKKLFETDDRGNTIRQIAKEDGQNWTYKKKSKGVVHQEVKVTSEDTTDINRWNYSDQNTVKNVVKNNSQLFGRDINGNEITDDARKDLDNWSAEYTETKEYDYTVKTTEISDEDYAAYQKGNLKVTDLINKYPDLFQKDSNGKTIDSDRLSANGWEVKFDDNAKLEQTLEAGDGYLHYVGKGGKLDFKQTYWPNSQMEIIESEEGEWEYLTKLPEGKTGENDADKFNSWETNGGKDPSYYWTIEALQKAKNLPIVRVEYGKQYTFTYKKSIDFFEFSYDGGEKTVTYTFNYYGLKTNNILKRSLFYFKDEEECDNFQMQVICMTPAELNKLSREDKDDTLDLIERADMYYVSSYNTQTESLPQLYKLYHRFVAKDNPSYSFNKEDVKTFYQNDLEWDLCMKMLKRLTVNQNLPIVYTQAVGELIDNGVAGGEPGTVSDAWLYLSSQQKNWNSTGSLNNIAKLYLLSIQFDFFAKREDGYERTFTEDIMPNFKTVSLIKDAVPGADPDSATTTGYYEREGIKAVNGNLDEDDKERCFYLWSIWTFYPSAVSLSDPISGSTKDLLTKYGYAATYFDTNTGTPFQVTATHQMGSNGTDNQNVAIVYSTNSNVNQSTLISNTQENSGVVSTVMNTAFQILNRRPDVIEPLTVSVVKQKKLYEKLSDNEILIDYRAAADYEADKTLYLKVTVRNTNNEDGIIKSIALVNEDGNKPSHYGSGEPVPQFALNGSEQLKKEIIYDSKNKNGVKGYRVTNEPLTFYVPYQLSDWQKGYNIVEFKLQGRIFSTKLKKSVLGNVTTSGIAIDERKLFSLK